MLTVEDGATLMAQASQGDVTAVPHLRRWLDTYAGEQAAAVADLSRLVEQDLLARIAGEDLALRELFARRQAALVQDLAGPQPSPLETLCAQRIAICALYLAYAEHSYLQDLHTLSMVAAEFHERRIDRAHRRYLTALRTLAQIRKLDIALQVNIAHQQQINTVLP